MRRTLRSRFADLVTLRRVGLGEEPLLGVEASLACRITADVRRRVCLHSGARLELIVGQELGASALAQTGQIQAATRFMQALGVVRQDVDDRGPEQRAAA